MIIYLSQGLLVKWSRRRPLTAETGVRLPYGSPESWPGADTRSGLFSLFLQKVPSSTAASFYSRFTDRGRTQFAFGLFSFSINKGARDNAGILFGLRRRRRASTRFSRSGLFSF